MSRRLCLASLLVFAVLTLPAQTFAGAWAQEDLGLYLKLSGEYETASEQYKETGETFQLLSEDLPGEYTGTAVSLYAEFGILPSLTIYGATSYKRLVISGEAIEGTTTGIGDALLGAKYQILDEPLVLSISGAIKAPTGYTPNPQEARLATLGNGVYEQEARLLVGRSFYPAPFYVSAEVGYRFRGSFEARQSTIDYPNEIPYFAEIGYGPFDWIWVRGVLSGLEGTGDPQALDQFTLTPLTQSWIKAGPSLIVTLFDDYQINADYLYTLSGINTIASHQVFVGVALDTTLGQTD